jgi:hypothetical protein
MLNCNQNYHSYKNIRLHEKCNRLQPIAITNYENPMSVTHSLTHSMIKEVTIFGEN